MNIVDSKYVDVKFEGGKVVVSLEYPVIEALRELAAKTDNKLDDSLVDLVEAALKNK